MALTLGVFERPRVRAEAVSLFGTDYPTPDGTCIRDYIHINDLVSTHRLALDALGTRNVLLYNPGNGVGYSNYQVIGKSCAVINRAIPVKELARRAGDSSRLVVAYDGIRRKLGWQSRYPDLKDIIASAWEWHRTYPNGYAST